MNESRWIPIIGALVLATMVGVVAYNSGVAHGVAQSAKIVAPPVAGAYPYAPYGPYGYIGWHPWPGFFFFPFFFFFVFIFVVRALFWRGRRHSYWGRCDLDEWHRRAHAPGGMTPESGGGTGQR